MMMELINVNQLKSIQLRIMDFFHNWCQENGITYFITAGTLIGALRHKGFIPWDDDIDVVMLRTDYERMLSLFPKSGRYQLYSIETDTSCIFPYAKIYDSETVMIEGDEKEPSYIGVNIDIFPLDNATNDYQDAVTMKKSLHFISNILGVKLLDRANRGFVKNVTVALLRFLAGFFSYSWLVKRIINKSKKYINNNDSRYIVNAVIYAKGEREILEREWFKESIDLEFEGRKYKAPIGADQYMRRLFGDYMQLPPADKRVSHHRFKAYYK
jgi:lipopolysaccharide cholinephosphotransferase